MIVPFDHWSAASAGTLASAATVNLIGSTTTDTGWSPPVAMRIVQVYIEFFAGAADSTLTAVLYNGADAAGTTMVTQTAVALSGAYGNSLAGTTTVGAAGLVLKPTDTLIATLTASASGVTAGVIRAFMVVAIDNP